jgi:hypothetical protein
MTKFEDNESPYLTLAEQASAPTTPGAGLWRAYAKSDGIYVVDDAGAETGPFGASGGGASAETWEDAMTALATGLVHRWKFEDASGSSVDDAVGSLDLTLSGTYTRNVDTGLTNLGKATTFGSGAKAVSSGLGSIPTGNNSRTIAAVFRTASVTASNEILCAYGTSGTRQDFGLLINNASDGADGPFDGATAAQMPNAWTADTAWHMLAATYKTGGILTAVVDDRFYAVKTAGVEATSSSGNLTVGAFVDGTTGPFLGDIADLAIWDRALGRYELTRLFRALQ